MARELPSFIIPPPRKPMRVDPLSFIVGAAVGAAVYHFMKPAPVQVVAAPKVEPKPVKSGAVVTNSPPYIPVPGSYPTEGDL
jgi:hypothetical protein